MKKITVARPPGLISTRIKEHKSRDTSAVFEHCQATGRNIKPRNRELKNHDEVLDDDVRLLGKDWNENVGFGGKKEG